MNSDSASTGTVSLDSDIVTRAQQGDSDAFAALFHAHKARIYSVCLRMTNNAAEAEDLTQDAFLAGVSQDRYLSRRFCVFNLASPHCGKHGVDAFSQEVPVPSFPGRTVQQ